MNNSEVEGITTNKNTGIHTVGCKHDDTTATGTGSIVKASIHAARNKILQHRGVDDRLER